MPSQPLVKRDWQKDHVYLIQFPRAGCIPSPSPFALKLETWLRVADLPYTNISNEFTKMSSKGQIPFIELNGRQVADSQAIIDFLGEHLHKEAYSKLDSPTDQANAIAYKALLENHLFWTLVYHRSRDNRWFATEKGFLGHFSGIKKFVFQKFVLGRIKSKMTGAVFAQGMGRNTKEEVIKIAKEDLNSLEQLLGAKPFFFGSKPHSLDCAVFGLLCQFLFTPLLSDEIKQHIEQSCPQLSSFVTRVKQQYWPDWDEATSKLSLDTKWKPE